MTVLSLPLQGVFVLDLSQFLAGPYASLRLQDLGARVIKVERPVVGDLCRSLYLSDTMINGESTIFHAINRGKESIALDLKNADDLIKLKTLIQKADILIQNFRPGVIERLGLDYESVRAIAPRLVYCSISGYGPRGVWAGLPGQDLLAQARSGIMWLNGSAGDGPVPFGLAVADMLAGANAAHGILAALYHAVRSGQGAHVETSLLESLVDLQFEVLATYLNDGGRPPERAAFRSAHSGLAAPYGVYETLDGWMALAMTPIETLVPILNAPGLEYFANQPTLWFQKRDEIKLCLASRLIQKTTAEWLALLEPYDIWCAKVLKWPELLSHPAFQELGQLQTVKTTKGQEIQLTKSPIRINGARGGSDLAAPSVGEQTSSILQEFMS